MKPDIIKRLEAYAEVSIALGAYTEANCAFDAIEEIEALRARVKELEANKEVDRVYQPIDQDYV